MTVFKVYENLNDTSNKTIRCKYGEMEFDIDYDDVDHKVVQATLLVMLNLLKNRNPVLEEVYTNKLRRLITIYWNKLTDDEKEEYHSDVDFYIYQEYRKYGVLGVEISPIVDEDVEDETECPF